jgi:hypothetical protein
MTFRWISALGLVCVTCAHAVTLTLDWEGGSGIWETAGNWNPVSVPSSSDVVRIDPAGAFNLTVTINSAANAHNLDIGVNDTVTVANARSLTLNGQGGASSLVLNSGSSLFLNSAGNNTTLQIDNTSVSVTGTGSIDLSNKSTNFITGTVNTNVLTNHATIQGAGSVGANTLVIQNLGEIIAQYATALIIDPSPAADSTNTGFLRAASGGLLQLHNGTIDNTGGEIHAADGGSVQLNGITIKDGTLSTAGSGSITVTGASSLAEDATIAANANVYVNNATSLSVADTLTIDGTLHVNSAGNSTDLIITSTNATFTGTGKVSLSNNFNNRIYGSPNTNTFVNQVTIEGAGQIGANSATIDNQGTISALYSTALRLDPLGGFTNTGTLNAATGGLLQLGAGTFANTGGIISAATGGEIELLSSTTITGGTLMSTGTGFIESRNSSTLDGVTLASGTLFQVPNATSATLLNTITNAGTISLLSAGNSTDLIIGAAGATLDGSGVIELSNNINNRIYGSTATNLLTNLNNTIRGSGQLGANQLAFDNHGTVEANLSGSTLTIDPATTTFNNTGTYRAVNGGILVLSSGSFNNTGGTIQAQTGSTVRLSNGAAVTHGTVDVGPGATLQLAGGSLDSGTVTTATGSQISTTSGSNTLGGTFDLTPGANLTLNNNTALTLLNTGSYTIDGTLTINSVGNTTDLIISGGDVTLGGSGKVVLNNNHNNRIYGASPTNRLVLNGVNLEGGGQLGANSMGITNQAVITANDTTALTIDPSAAGVTNTGTLRADGGTLVLTGGTYDNTGGLIEATTGSTVQFSGSTFTGGTLGGLGTLTTIGSNTFNNVSINSGTVFTNANNTGSTFVTSLHNAGEITLNSLGNFTDFIAGSGGLTLTGGGDIKLIGSNSRIYGVNGTTSLTNTNNRIHGYGQLGANQLVFDNQSDVVANVAGQTLTVDTSGDITNSGLFKAENGATLRIQSSTFQNQTGGSIESASGSNVFFSNLTLNDGHLTGTGIFRNISTSTYANPTIDSGTVLDIDNNTAATFSGTLNNAGQVHLNSAGNFTDFVAQTGGLTLSGGGEIHLYGSINNRIYGQTGSVLLTNIDHIIRGYGQLGANQLAFDNQGTVTADASGQILTVDTSSGLTNSGTLKAENGGTLLFSGSVITNQSGGSINSGTGSSVRFSGSTLNDGVISGPGTIVNVSTSTYHNLSLGTGSTLDINNNTSAQFSGTLHNDGQISLNSVGNLTDFVALSPGLTVTGTGTIRLTGHINNRLYGQNTATTVTNSSGHTIAGYGQLGAGQLLLQNFGTIDADTGATLTIDLASSTFTNQGTLRASGSGGLSINDALTNQQDIEIASGSALSLPGHAFVQSAGSTNLSGGTFTAASFQVDGGDFDGHGSIQGPAAFTAGFLAPAPGGLSFSSSLTLDSTTTVQIELAGVSSSTGYGQISATDIVLGGTLEVRFGSGFQNIILPTDTFTIFTASNSGTGSFLNAPDGTRFWTSDGLGSFDITYNALSVTLSNFQPVPEPSTWMLLVVGGALVVLQSSRRRRRP